MLEKEYGFFKRNLPKLLKSYEGAFLLIKGEKVVGIFDTHEAALSAGLSKYQLGKFLVQQCVDKKDSTAQFFNSYFLLDE